MKMEKEKKEEEKGKLERGGTPSIATDTSNFLLS